MSIDEAPTVRTNYWPLWIFFVLMFAGLSITTLGIKYNETLFIGTGIVFVLITMFTFRSTILIKAVMGAFAGMLVGALAGVGIGLAIGGVAESLVGAIGGVVIGAFVGMIIVSSVIEAFGVPVLPGIKVLILPERVFPALLTIGALAGGLVGFNTLRETVIKVFGSIGGGAVAIGSIGIIVGLLLGHREPAVIDEGPSS